MAIDLDRDCWRCGQMGGLPFGSALLCVQCQRKELTESPPRFNPVNLEECWRCKDRRWLPDEELGLCEQCRAELRENPQKGTDGRD